ncbi:MAG: hypothetical protein EXS39_04470 [Opitutaceae bacterium]|nr:hypothetical protein [Opitutaceae bacterium]
MNLPEELTAYLTDEAYSTLCRQSLNEGLENIENEKQEVMMTRPPFGMLATKQARETFETSLKAVLDNETGIRRRLKQLDLIDPKLQTNIQEALHLHLLETSGHEYLSCSKAWEITDEWSHGISALHEHGVAVARDARSLVAVIENTPATHRSAARNRARPCMGWPTCVQRSKPCRSTLPRFTRSTSASCD